MKNSKYLRYMVVFAVGIALILNYMRFISYYKELSNIDENFIYVYTDSYLPEGIVEECHKYQIDCEIWNIGKEEELCGEGLTHTAVGYEVKKLMQDRMPVVFLNEDSTQLEDENKDYPDENGAKIIEDENEGYSKKNKEYILKGKISIAMVKGIEALGYHETENLFLGSDFIIDVNLLKWIVYIIIFFCFFCIMLFCFCQNKKWGYKKWFYLVVMLIWFLYVKIFIFASIVDFPVWSLPGKWSDLEGWGKLGEEVMKQISYVIHFKDYPIICKYYEGIIKSIFYLLLSLILVYLFFKCSLRLKHFLAVHIVMTIIAFGIYIYCSDKDIKALIYFLPCFIGSFICKEICQE